MDHRRAASDTALGDRSDFLDEKAVDAGARARRATQRCIDGFGLAQYPHDQSITEPRHTHLRQPSTMSHNLAIYPQHQPSPPLTPRQSLEAMSTTTRSERGAIFHNYLRAFYPFCPSSSVSAQRDESSITVPIDRGDLILVHSIHPNGWADGTLLHSGARGWLPTNYCEPYDPHAMRCLLNALTNLWDLVRTSEPENLVAFSRQDYVRGMIAGVRFLLETTKCLSRESPSIKSHTGLRRLRKHLLADLSSMVKTAKQLQDTLKPETHALLMYELLDGLVLKAFQVIIKGVRFFDVWSQDVAPRTAQYFELSDSQNRPLTPPADTSDHDSGYRQTTGSDIAENGLCHRHSVIVLPAESIGSEQCLDAQATLTRSSSSVHAQPLASAQPNASAQGLSQPTQPVPRPHSRQTHRLSVSHRVSYVGQLHKINRLILASERLTAAHDSFLSLLGTFIGLHLQSRPAQELTTTTRECVSACRELLLVVADVWERDGRRSDQLQQAQDTMYIRLTELVQATKEMFIASASGEDVLNTNESAILVNATTHCIRAAGECVSKTRAVLERIGDFEFESSPPGLADAIFGALNENAPPTPSSPTQSQRSEPQRTYAFHKPFQLPPKPTPQPPPPPVFVPGSEFLAEPQVELLPIGTAEDLPEHVAEEKRPLPVVLSYSPVQPQSSLAITRPDSEEDAPGSSTQHSDFASPNSFCGQVKPASVSASVADTNSTWRNSGPQGNGSSISLVSTRATTPDKSPRIKGISEPSASLNSSFGSIAELHCRASEEAVIEARVLEKTYAHELVYNKEGQIIGGSLPALIEQLTMHDATPDVTFVTAFYLTFRLFTTAVDFARGLVERFEYIGNSQHIGVPVRLRVYNVFKGWLELHWQPEADSPALTIITDFASGSLGTVLPAAGQRLLELAGKVSDPRVEALVPRLVSSLGKTCTSLTTFAAADSQIPTPNVTKTQINALRLAKNGGPPCSILDFDPLELARQFTIIESRIFCAIRPEELLALEWMKKTDSRAINVKAMSTLATDLANLVADTILSLEEPKKRAVIIKQWVKIAMKCQELNNYDSLMAIICALNSSMVLRLKKTWEQVSQKNKTRLEELKKIVDVGRNYAVLRQRLQNHVAPCIPFVGIYLTDLTFVDVGNQTTRQLPGDGRDGDNSNKTVINFDKHMKTAKIIGQVQRFQMPYPLAAVPEMQDWMESQIQRVRHSDQSNVQSYYRRSLLLEPRDQPPRKQKGDSSSLDGDHKPKESVTGIGAKDRFDLWGTLHLGGMFEKHAVFGAQS